MKNKTSFPWYKSLYLRIAAFLFVILFLLGVAYLIIDVVTAKRYFDETTQKLNAPVAAHMLLEVSPFENGKVLSATSPPGGVNWPPIR